jgi:NADH-quinone oxidoreductase subunit D
MITVNEHPEKNGERVVDLFFGPQHAGVSGNFKLVVTVHGETIRGVDLELGYLHRGFEKMLENVTYIQGFPFVCRMNVLDPDHNEQVYAMAIEELSGLEVPPRAHYIRTLVLEMARLSSHLMWLSSMAGSLGFYTINHWAMIARDEILDMFSAISGARVYHIYILPGGVRRDLPEGFAERMREFLTDFEGMLHDFDAVMFNNRVFRRRTEGVGVLSREDALRWGATGPVLRGTGVARDVRVEEPYAAYGELDFEIPTRDGGDSFSRAMVIRKEMGQSVSIIRQVLEKIPAGPVWTRTPNPFKWKIARRDAYVRVESSRGELGMYAVTDGSDKLRRLSYRGPSLPHGLVILPRLLAGMTIADVAHMVSSLNIAIPELDR